MLYCPEPHTTGHFFNNLTTSACVLTSALLINSKEGHPGRYFGTEIRPEAGKLLSGKYKTVGEIIYGDSIGTQELG